VQFGALRQYSLHYFFVPHAVSIVCLLFKVYVLISFLERSNPSGIGRNAFSCCHPVDSFDMLGRIFFIDFHGCENICCLMLTGDEKTLFTEAEGD
jgi:hypothetical protein